MFLDGLGAAEGDNLGRVRGGDGEEGAGNDGETIGVVISGDVFGRCDSVNFTIFTHVKGGEDASEAREFEGGFCGYLLFVFNELKRTLEGIGEIGCWVRQGAGGGQREPRRARDDDRALTIAGSALVGQLERCCARSGEKDVGRAIGVEGGEARIIGGLDGKQMQWPDRDRPAAAQRVDGARG
jgi:hypothetical protein